MLAGVHIGQMVEGDEMGIPFYVLAGTEKNRVNGYAGKILNPFDDTLLKVFPGDNAAPGNGKGPMLDLPYEEDLTLGVFDDNAGEIFDTRFHKSKS